MGLLPSLCLTKYVEFQTAEKEKGTPDLEIVRKFMNSERKHQKRMQQLRGEESGGGMGHSTDSHSAPHPGRDKSKDQCKVCSGFGHHAKDCGNKKTPSKSHSSQQVGSQPKESCPFCKKQGRDETHEYQPGMASTRLSSCKTFRDAGPEE